MRTSVTFRTASRCAPPPPGPTAARARSAGGLTGCSSSPRQAVEVARALKLEDVKDKPWQVCALLPCSSLPEAASRSRRPAPTSAPAPPPRRSSRATRSPGRGSTLGWSGSQRSSRTCERRRRARGKKARREPLTSAPTTARAAAARGSRGAREGGEGRPPGPPVTSGVLCCHPSAAAAAASVMPPRSFRASRRRPANAQGWDNRPIRPAVKEAASVTRLGSASRAERRGAASTTQHNPHRQQRPKSNERARRRPARCWPRLWVSCARPLLRGPRPRGAGGFGTGELAFLSQLPWAGRALLQRNRGPRRLQ